MKSFFIALAVAAPLAVAAGNANASPVPCDAPNWVQDAFKPTE